ncbi:MAG: isoaspartyl peptidase/L-asparaginase family protein [Anaerolineae bacterium]
MKPAIIIHGGAGAWELGSDRIQEAISACRAAAVAGQQLLVAASSALDAVETAVRLLEDNPALDAGRGSYPNARGEVEMDAFIMDGRTLDLGAVAAVQRIRHPISLARRVLTDTAHNLLVGAGAEAFADSISFPRCTAEELLADNVFGPALQTGQPSEESGAIGDTVGAVAIDLNGNVAAATSTGGTRDKMPGRVGDSPLVGSGGYADNWTAAVSATGHGEALMKVVISKRVCDFVGSGSSAQAACEAAVRLLEDRVKGVGGMIAVDARGQVGFAFNTAAMPHAYAVGDDPVVSGR